MNKILFYINFFAACALMIASAKNKEFQFAAIMFGIFAIINKTKD